MLKAIISLSLLYILSHGKFLFAEQKYYAHHDAIHVYSATTDSIYAQQALNILIPAWQEITFDLKIKGGKTINVFIAANRQEFRKFSRGKLPNWTGAFAEPFENSIFLKSPRWDKSQSFKYSVIHELWHILLYQKIAYKKFPRWLDEGMAIFYSRDPNRERGSVLSKAMVTNSLIPLEQIDYVLNFHTAKADLAYQQSYSATKYLLTTYDIDAIQTIINGIITNKSIDDIFISATGSSFDKFEKEWIAYAKKNI